MMPAGAVQKRKTIFAHARAAIGTALIVFVVALLLNYDRTPPFELTEGEIIPSKVRGGDKIETRWRLTLLRDRAYSFECRRWIVDVHGHPRPVEEQEVKNTLPPASDFITRSIVVPYEVGWGPATYRQSCCYQFEGLSLTKLFPICLRRPVISFEVLPTPKL